MTATAEKKPRRLRKRDVKPPHPAHPRFWFVWLLMMPFTWIISWAPWPVQRFLGHRIGDLTWALLRSRRRITLRNLELCFPEKSEAWRQQVGRDVFRSTGIAVFESSRAWWRSKPGIARDFDLVGMENLERARAEGRGVLLFGLHRTTLEISGMAAACFFPVNAVFRPQNNAGMDALVRWRRARAYHRQIDRRDTRQLYRSLKEGEVTWYTGDQDYGRQHAVFAPFFGVPAATLVAGMRMVRSTNAIALGMDFRRDDRTGRYVLDFSEPLPYNGDDEHDAKVMNDYLESVIRQAPGQYMWYHKRFKTLQDPNSPSMYRKR